MKLKVGSKKDGFTLIEVIAALAIISILSIILVPKVGKYIEEAKKTKALDDVRQVVLSIEDYSISSGNKIEENERFASIKFKIKTWISKNKKQEEFIDLDNIKSLSADMQYSEMQELINGKKNFTLKDGKIAVTN